VLSNDLLFFRADHQLRKSVKCPSLFSFFPLFP
jgi:hypothetical protein